MFFLATEKTSFLFKTVVICLLLSFTLMSSVPAQALAQGVFSLPAPGSMVNLSPGFVPVMLRGIKVYPDNPLRFDFIIDSGNTGLQADELKSESEKLAKYFLASLTTPEKDLWVNLSPYEDDRIIPESLGQTDMGRDLLAQDYILKQITASLIYPDSDTGKDFWVKVYKKAYEEFGTTKIPVNTFNKVWIVPDRAVVYEDSDRAIVTESHLKVMLEQDYLSLENNSQSEKLGTQQGSKESAEKTSELSSRVVREVVLPLLEKEVNEGKNFATLRQMYHAMVLATWYKQALKTSILNKVYSDKNKVAGVNVDDPKATEKIYDQYLDAFEKGVCDFVRIEQDPATKKPVARKYFSGGFEGENISSSILSKPLSTLKTAVTAFVVGSMFLTNVALANPSQEESYRSQLNDLTTSVDRYMPDDPLQEKARRNSDILNKSVKNGYAWTLANAEKENLYQYEWFPIYLKQAVPFEDLKKFYNENKDKMPWKISDEINDYIAGMEVALDNPEIVEYLAALNSPKSAGNKDFEVNKDYREKLEKDRKEIVARLFESFVPKELQEVVREDKMQNFLKRGDLSGKFTYRPIEHLQNQDRKKIKIQLGDNRSPGPMDALGYVYYNKRVVGVIDTKILLYYSDQEIVSIFKVLNKPALAEEYIKWKQHITELRAQGKAGGYKDMDDWFFSNREWEEPSVDFSGISPSSQNEDGFTGETKEIIKDNFKDFLGETREYLESLKGKKINDSDIAHLTNLLGSITNLNDRFLKSSNINENMDLMENVLKKFPFEEMIEKSLTTESYEGLTYYISQAYDFLGPDYIQKILNNLNYRSLPTKLDREMLERYKNYLSYNNSRFNKYFAAMDISDLLNPEYIDDYLASFHPDAKKYMMENNIHHDQKQDRQSQLKKEYLTHEVDIDEWNDKIRATRFNKATHNIFNDGYNEFFSSIDQDIYSGLGFFRRTVPVSDFNWLIAQKIDPHRLWRELIVKEIIDTDADQQAGRFDFNDLFPSGQNRPTQSYILESLKDIFSNYKLKVSFSDPQSKVVLSENLVNEISQEFALNPIHFRKDIEQYNKNSVKNEISLKDLFNIIKFRTVISGLIVGQKQLSDEFKPYAERIAQTLIFQQNENIDQIKNVLREKGYISALGYSTGKYQGDLDALAKDLTLLSNNIIYLKGIGTYLEFLDIAPTDIVFKDLVSILKHASEGETEFSDLIVDIVDNAPAEVMLVIKQAFSFAKSQGFIDNLSNLSSSAKSYLQALEAGIFKASQLGPKVIDQIVDMRSNPVTLATKTQYTGTVLMVLPESDDNSAFDTEIDIIKSLLDHGYYIYFVSKSNINELKYEMEKFKDNKGVFDIVYVGGHGYTSFYGGTISNGLVLGEAKSQDQANEMIINDQSAPVLKDFLGPLLSKGGNVILSSCMGGIGLDWNKKNTGNVMRTIFPQAGKIFSADESISEVIIDFDEAGKIKQVKFKLGNKDVNVYESSVSWPALLLMLSSIGIRAVGYKNRGENVFLSGELYTAQDLFNITKEYLKSGHGTLQIFSSGISPENSDKVYLADSMQEGEQVGGIDLNATNLELRRTGSSPIQFNLPPEWQGVDLESIPGFVPVIINITPVADLYPLLGLEESSNKIFS
ncbi:MAG TPA: hypothetical protein PKO44_00300 [Candidatus Omnitrophota bacterium]|nr:hypothetical protein [Candidatus Omnitrophota bacterium]